MCLSFHRRCCIPLIWLVFHGMCAWAQGPSVGCEKFLRFQIELSHARHQNKLQPSVESLQVTAGDEPLSLVSLLPFDLHSRTNNTVSLLIIVWDGGLRADKVEKLAASFRKEERLHLRLAVLTKHDDEISWTDDPVTQRKLLYHAAAESSSLPEDAPGYRPKNSDDQVLERRWDDRLRTSIEDTIVQPGKQVILELLPPPPLRPPEGAEHWRIPSDRDYAGEQQVHAFAALGLVPVYRVHNQTPALEMIIPGGDASYSPPLGAGGNVSAATAGQEQLARLQSMSIPSTLPPPSRLFADLGGKDIFEAKDALSLIQMDLRQVYSVVARTPNSCRPRGLAPLRIQVANLFQKSFMVSASPQWAAYHLLQRPTP